MLCRLLGQFFFNYQMPIILFVGLCGCDTLYGLPYEIESVDKSEWPAIYINAASDISNERCDEFVKKIIPFISNNDADAIYLMFQAMRRGLVFNEKTTSPAKHLIDGRRANIDLLVFYSGLSEYKGKYKIFTESAQERLDFIERLLNSLDKNTSTDQAVVCYRTATSQECYQNMINLKIIPSLKQRIAELKKSYDAHRLSATCRTGYSKIKTPQ